MIGLFKKHSNHMSYAKCFRLLGVLLKQGYSMEDALSFMLIHQPIVIVERLSEVKLALKSGQEIHKAFSLLPIPKDIVSFLYFYQFHGDVSDGFIHAGTLLEKRLQTTQQLFKLMRYPILLIWICLVVLLVLHQFVIPHFNSLFLSMQGEPPLLTVMVLKFLVLMPYLGFALLLFTLSGLSYFLLFKHKWSPKRRVESLLKIPWLSAWVKQLCTYFFSLQVGRLLRSGTSLQDALNIFEQQPHLPFFQQEVISIKVELQLGRPFYELVRERDYFLRELSFVVENGERTGHLGSDLDNFSGIIYSELEEKLNKIMDFLQPVIFIVLGAFIFILFLAIMLPMFQMIGTLQ
ncbi:competence type IV pilus assembly protein ComGB [Alkalihalophilus lindianensis]|uniref:Competence type IV pilus assembly protein ComGB n=2 Tax=Alkalihalophilus lindianensis TaxID=1630542 RepID=A0ABU3XB36_9BACI|nr:competence type IV pilus assembly protein ComGB [Alkalihalophilus lindianensis]